MVQDGTHDNPFQLDPNDALYFKFSAAVFLAGGETITGYTLTPQAGLTVSNDSRTDGDQSVTFRVEPNGVLGRLVVTVFTVLSTGEEVERNMHFYVSEQ